MIIDSEIKVYSECGWCKNKSESITLSDKVIVQIISLCKKYESKEWGAVFTVRDGVVTELLIPKQIVSGSAVEFLEELGGNGCIHSHNNMDAFWSTTDNTTFRDRYEYSIVINNKLEYNACHRVKLPCGGFGYQDLVVRWGNYIIPENKIQDYVTLPTYSPSLPVSNYVTVRDNMTGTWEYQEAIADLMSEICSDCSVRECRNCKVPLVIDRMEEIWTAYQF
jgi:hypothetical protein